MLLVSDLLYQLGPTKNNPDELVKHPMEKMQILVNYIAENMENNETDQEALNDVIFAAKKNIAETIINLEEEEGLSVEQNKQLHFDTENLEDNNMGTTMTSMFLLAPETITRNLTEGNLQDGPEDAQSEESEEERTEKKEKLKNAFKLLQGKEASYAAYEQQYAEVKTDMLFLENMFPNESDYPLQDAREKIKAGFFEKVFSRTSKEFKNFERTFNAREKGNATREQVDNAAKAYLMAKIPGWDGKDIPTVQQLNTLTGKQRDRAMFCIKTLMANQESREYEGKFRALMNVARNNMNEYGADTLRMLKESNSNPIQDVDAYLAGQVNQQPQQEEQQVEESDFKLQEYIAKDLAEENQVVEDEEYSNEASNLINEYDVQKDDEELGLD